MKFFQGNYIHKLLVFVTVVTLVIVAQGGARADELEEINKQISDLQNQLQLSINATTPLEAEVDRLEGQINSIQARINATERELTNLESSIEEREQDLGARYLLFASKVRDYHKKSQTHPFFLRLIELLSSGSLENLTRDFAYREATADEDKNYIVSVTKDIIELEEDKARLEEDTRRLAVSQANLDKQIAFFEGEIAGAKKWQSTLQGQIAELSAKQQSIIDARSGSFTFTLGSGELADEYLASAAGFQDQAPSGYFAVFSFGGYSHRNGMSQYGARGRASQGQSAEEILTAYYPGKELKKDYSEPGTIRVVGNGTSCFKQPDGTYNKYYDEEVDFQKYLKGIHEVPQTWPIETLKAQAVAARTYAIRIGSPIKPNQSHQVYKDCEKGGGWPSAVEQTKNWVLLDGGSPAFTEYSSTAGGYLRTSGWDTTDGSGGSGFIDKSYERLGNSPWLEKSWWREGYSVSGNTCGRSNPWLSPQEMADIVNAAIALQTGGIDTSRITPVTTSCWGGDPYSMDELRDLVAPHGGISSATSVSVSQGNGTTSSITINGITINPSDFRRAFNLRAPGYLRIPQYPGTYGNPFFNIVKK